MRTQAATGWQEPRFLRDMFGRFASGVTIVTCGGPQTTHGMTANAFTSVSLEPALGLVAIAQTALMHARLLASDHFAVSVLADHHHAASDHFAGRGNAGYQPRLVQRQGVAVLGDALAWMVLSRETEFAVGTHTLFVGRVIDCGYREDAAPLIFFGGSYQALAPGQLQQRAKH